MSRAAYISLAITACLPGVLVLWSWAVGKYYRLRGPRPDRLEVVCADGWTLALFRRRANVKRYAEPVLLCHGLAANHVNFDFEPPYSLAHHLADAGFDCYTVEWRGTRASAHPAPGRRRGDYTVDDHIRFDAEAAIQGVLKDSGAKEVFWVGHSLGGLIGYGAAQGRAGAAMRGLVTLGSPAYFSHHRKVVSRALKIGTWLAWPWMFRQELVSRALAPFLGHVTLPLSDVLVNPRHLSPRMQRRLYAVLISSIGRRVMLQFRDWVENDVFRSADGRTDYRNGMASVRVATLVMGGSKDGLAPAGCIEAAYEKLGCEDKTLVLFGADRGDQMEYGHGDLIFGTGAPTEVYPTIRRWLESHATRAENAPATSAA